MLLKSISFQKLLILSSLRSMTTAVSAEVLQSKQMFKYSVDSAEQPRPATNKQYPRMYGHNLCAFSERVRLAFRAKALDFQHVEMDLHSKAKWHMDVNGGLVPLLEMPDGQFFIESKILMELANDLAGPDKGFDLYSKDYRVAAKQRLVMD